MTDHLPECYQSEGKFDAMCICDRLRACEQRVLSLNPVGLGVLIAQRARERALDAAREAISALPFVSPAHYGKDALIAGAQPDFVRRDVLATIDALREKR